MCGIVGFIGKSLGTEAEDLSKMISSIRHRGPDSNGVYQKGFLSFQVSFGHVRLSIIDTSAKANQPMVSNDGRYILIYNGEIYNFNEIKEEISFSHPEYIWETHSDTEVLLAGIQLIGLENVVQKAAGMFAFALWDDQEQKLSLVRDRIGEKPLYYGYQNGVLIFASELKAIQAHSCFANQINYKAAINYFRNGVISGNDSIYTGISKLTPGTILQFTSELIEKNENGIETAYWKLSDVVGRALKHPFRGSYEDAVLAFEQLLIKVIKEQSISDVPIGAFLSGGIDSSTVCAIMKNHVKSDLRTFCIGMPPPGADEAFHAEAVANHIESIHVEKYLGIEEIKDRIDEIVDYWDEPFADSSQIPTFFVAELAKKYVTVSLSGDGADEFLVGYESYRLFEKFKSYSFLKYLPVQFFLKTAVFLFPRFKKMSLYKKINSFIKVLSLKNIGAVNSYWRNKFRGFEIPVKKQLLDKTFTLSTVANDGFFYAGYYDALNYLPDDILVKVDRSTMAVSLESRAPFLDHRILEFIISLPMSYKFENGIAKRILKDVLYKYVPEKIVNRPKQGFSIPISTWLRQDLYVWASDIISGIDDKSEFWDKKEVLNFWDEHCTFKHDHGERIWSILVMEMFLRKTVRL
jgi:asparagine synthase (glutamine-hydrolysing)